MKKVLICYFSGTGNTALVARSFQKQFAERGWQCDLYELFFPVENFPVIENYDLLGFGYPIHAFNVPLTFLNFVKANFPKCHLPYFIFKSSGEPFHLNDSSSHTLYCLLKHKGYEFVMEQHFLMPYNIVFRYPKDVVKQMYLYLDPIAAAMTQRLVRGEKDKPHHLFIHRMTSFFFRIEWIAPAINGWFTHVNPKKCIRCDRCIHACPNRALYRNSKGHLRINNRCSLCMRCTMDCPVDAFHFGFLNHWKVVGRYPFEEIKNDPAVLPYHVYWGTKDYFRRFRFYFEAQDELLKKEGIPLPIAYPTNPSTH